jgi:acetyltransferase-like isoleucine patch superfamily enzyme
LEWIQCLDNEFSCATIDHRSTVVRDTLHQLYYGQPFSMPETKASLTPRVCIHNFDPRNITLEAEYYGDVDAERYAIRKPLIWLWLMFDRSPAGQNHWLGFRLRAMLAKHIFKYIGRNVKLFHGVEFSFGYNLTVEDDCVIHRNVLLDDRGEIIIYRGCSISDYANVYSHDHDLNDSMIVTNRRTEIGPHARITYHSTVMSGVRVHEHGLLGSMGVATRDIEPYTVAVGIPGKAVKVKSVAPKGAEVVVGA